MALRTYCSALATKLSIRSTFIRTMASAKGSDSGSAGSIRDAGGAFGKREAAQEEVYFSQQNQAMKKKLKDHLAAEIKKHEEAIKKNSEILNELEADEAPKKRK